MPKKPEERTYRITPIAADPLASLRPQGLVIDWDDTQWRIPALPALTWLEILLAEEIDYEAIFPGLCGDDAVLDVNWRILNGATDELEPVIRDCIEAVSGRRWWITLRLVQIFRSNWEGISAPLIGVDLERVSLGSWLDGAYGVLVEKLSSNPQHLSEFTARLVAPPPSERTEVDDEVEGNAFLAAMRLAR